MLRGRGDSVNRLPRDAEPPRSRRRATAGPHQRLSASARSRRAPATFYDVPDASTRACGTIHSIIEEKLLTRGERVCRTPDRMALRLGRGVDLVVVAAFVCLVAEKVDLTDAALVRGLRTRGQS